MSVRTLARRVRARVPVVAWLTLVWVLLWGSFTPLTIVGGALVGTAVVTLFRLPHVPDRLPVRPLQLARLVGYLGYDLVVCAVDVSWQTVRYGRRARSAIVAVPLLSSSDRVVAFVANALSLSPGTMALLIDYQHELFYVYALGPRDRAGAERARLSALRLQRRVLAALGTPAELAEAQRQIGLAVMAP